MAHATGKQNLQSEMFSVPFPVIIVNMTFPLPLSSLSFEFEKTSQLYSLSWIPLERNGTFRIMEVTTGSEQLPSAEMSENCKPGKGR